MEDSHWLHFFQNSTQLTQWTFNELTLLEKRQKILLSTILTAEEEELLRFYFESYLYKKCEELQANFQTICTAIVYLKRYMLTTPLNFHDMFSIMASCIFLASKTEEVHFPARHISKVFHISVESIAEAEVVLLSALSFHLVLWHPFRSAKGLLQDLNIYISKQLTVDPATSAQPSNPETVNANLLSEEQFLQTIQPMLKIILFTDLCFLIRPGRIALVVVHKLFGSEKPVIEEYVMKYLGKDAQTKINFVDTQIAKVSALQEKCKEKEEYLQKTLLPKITPMEDSTRKENLEKEETKQS
ncbi:Cyclin-H [Monocercomonoides exilis]|uniref:Cyclin-H n=1 Tax=Monocercomonoides exilis TaxID=2049356 RepID=UPI0035597177|nr:Cyclin-H [Monocercomonoides exilis]